MPDAPVDIETRHGHLWTAATHHAFLDAVRDATISTAAFDAWLVQDYLFVVELLAFQARLLARAPRSGHEVLAGGLVAVVDELTWFEQLAADRGLDLDQPPLPTTRAYTALLHRLDAVPYATAVAGLWVLERVYLQAWAYATPPASTPNPYRDYVEHWTAPGFAGYVQALEGAVDAAGGDIDESLLIEVLQHEVAFWDMALDASGR